VKTLEKLAKAFGKQLVIDFEDLAAPQKASLLGKATKKTAGDSRRPVVSPALSAFSAVRSRTGLAATARRSTSRGKR
jgi:hypothetical protein